VNSIIRSSIETLTFKAENFAPAANTVISASYSNRSYACERGERHTERERKRKRKKERERKKERKKEKLVDLLYRCIYYIH